MSAVTLTRTFTVTWKVYVAKHGAAASEALYPTAAEASGAVLRLLEDGAAFVEVRRIEVET